MSKPALFGVLFLWLVMITFIVNSIVEYDPTTDLGINNPVEVVEQDEETGWAQVTSLMGTYWNALTFGIDGLPAIFNLFFQVPTAIIAFMITRFVIDALPL